MDDLSDLVEAESNYRQNSRTLLSKFKIPIHHFEFDYVEKCNDGKELENILLILRSGEEGHFPDLIKSAECRLQVIKPKSKLLRMITGVINRSELKSEELEEVSADLHNWVLTVSKNDNELVNRKSSSTHHESEIRTVKEANIKSANLTKDKEKRIGATDYSAWDKYDPDTELLKMQLEEEKTRNASVDQQKIVKIKKKVNFNKFATQAEAIFDSTRESEMGQEFFDSGEFEEALQCYTNSILSKPCEDNLNNRAMTYLKLKKYEEAVDDCNRVLAFDKFNEKSHLMKAEALKKMEKYTEALENVDFVINRDPNNEFAQELADRIRKEIPANSRNTKTRMKIVEID